MLKVKFVDFWEGFNFYKDITLKILRKNFGDVMECDTPDFLFYSVFGYEHLKYDCVRIFWTGENLIPDFNICDYGIGFAYMEYEDRYLRAPLYLFYQQDYERAKKKHLLSDLEIRNKTKFCNFVYSNNKATSDRARLFNLLTEYKKVDSGGRYMNNIGGPVEDKYVFQKEYKFSIAFENCSSNGYVTEKLIQAFAASTIPIYWGDKTVIDTFNDKAFINCHNFDSLEDVVAEVVRIDQDDELFLSYLTKPIWKEHEQDLLSLDEYERYICEICSKDPKTAIRRNNERIGKKYQYQHLQMANLFEEQKEKNTKTRKNPINRLIEKVRK